MRTLLILTISLFTGVNSIVAQEQYVSQNINHDLYEDAACKVFLQSSGVFEFPLTITWNYEVSSILFIAADGEEWLSATWKSEVDPDKITGDENNRFIFDPAKNDLGMKVLKIYLEGDGTFTYNLECGKQIIAITGIDSDGDGNGIGDMIDEYNAMNEDIESEISDAEQTPAVYLNLNNSTDFTIFLSTNVENEDGQWTLANEWITIPPGESFMIGKTYNDHFYYYAFCKDSKGQFVTWEGTDQYHVVENSDGSYGFRHVSLTEGAFDDSGEVWFMDLKL